VQKLISVAEADSLIRQYLTTAPVEAIPLSLAQGRYLREDILADRPLPPFDRVMMDGIAIKHSSWVDLNRTFPIINTQAAGAPPTALLDDDSCIEVMTGCVLPDGCDCVIPVEQIKVKENTAHIQVCATLSEGQHIHRAGSDTKGGETLLNSGQLLEAPELAIAASCGATTPQVSILPKILIISTGDEVVAPEETPLPYQIRRSHATALTASIESSKLGTVSDIHVQDEPEALETAVKEALTNYDIIVLTGGVSRGKYDYVAPVLQKLIGDPIFHGVAQRPGKPLAFWAAESREERKRLIFALPGNPVSVMACAARYLLPALREIASGNHPEMETLTTTGSFNCPPHFTGLTACRVKNGRIHLVPPSNSGNFLSLAGTHGVAELSGSLARKELFNEPAKFYPW